jgi:hypothetical protein
VREKNQINNNKNVYSSSARDSGANVVVDEPACREYYVNGLIYSRDVVNMSADSVIKYAC